MITALCIGVYLVVAISCYCFWAYAQWDENVAPAVVGGSLLWPIVLPFVVLALSAEYGGKALGDLGKRHRGGSV